MTRGARRPVTVLLLAALAACSHSVTATPSPSVPESDAEPSLAAPSESAVALCGPGTICNGPVTGGDYVSEATGARVEFTLDDHGWYGLAETPGVGFGLFLADVDDAAISVLAFGGEYFIDACDPNGGTSTTGTTPAEFMAMLTTRTGITATDPIEVEIGGRPALQVDLTTTIEPECEVTGDPQIWVWTLPVGGPFDFYEDEMARVIAVDGGSATLILVAEARSVVKDYDHFLEHFTEVVETMTITPL